jgi:hypothetical protein
MLSKLTFWKKKSVANANAIAKASIELINHSSQIREKSPTEPRQHYQKPGHGLFFCLHERSYFVECRACRRTRSDGEENERAMIAKLNP